MIGLLVSLAWLLCAPEEAELLFVGDAMMHQRQIDATASTPASTPYAGG